MKKNQGIFCISLDTELFWGVHDTLDVSTYGEKIFNAKHYVIGKLLNIFNEYDIHATWVVVGAILAKNYEDLSRFYQKKINAQHIKMKNGLLTVCFRILVRI